MAALKVQFDRMKAERSKQQAERDAKNIQNAAPYTGAKPNP